MLMGALGTFRHPGTMVPNRKNNSLPSDAYSSQRMAQLRDTEFASHVEQAAIHTEKKAV
jgi:hypothetical protein